MQNLRWNISLLAIIALTCQLTLAMPSSLRVKRDEILSDINPNEVQESSNNVQSEREKRKLPDAHFAGKNAVLGFVFGNDELTEDKRTRRAVPDVDDPDTPNFDRNMVMLDIPPRLFSQSFTTVTNLSKLVGNFISNSARRYAKVVYFFKPVFGNTLEVEGHNYVPTTTTKKPSSK